MPRVPWLLCPSTGKNINKGVMLWSRAKPSFNSPNEVFTNGKNLDFQSHENGFVSSLQNEAVGHMLHSMPINSPTSFDKFQAWKATKIM